MFLYCLWVLVFFIFWWDFFSVLIVVLWVFVVSSWRVCCWCVVVMRLFVLMLVLMWWCYGLWNRLMSLRRWIDCGVSLLLMFCMICVCWWFCCRVIWRFCCLRVIRLVWVSVRFILKWCICRVSGLVVLLVSFLSWCGLIWEILLCFWRKFWLWSFFRMLCRSLKFWFRIVKLCLLFGLILRYCWCM